MYETAELTRMFGEGYSVYKICRNLNRSQKSIRNNLIRLGLIAGEITARRYTGKSNDVVVDDSIGSLILNYTWNIFTLSFLSMVFVLNPQYNIIEIIFVYFFAIWFWFMDIDKRATDLALHLLDIETKSKVRKNKRSPSDFDNILDFRS